jgi:hypothetical protein
MKAVNVIASTTPQVLAGYTVLFASLTVGFLILPFSLQLALLPTAVLAGWSQIGGL